MPRPDSAISPLRNYWMAIAPDGPVRCGLHRVAATHVRLVRGQADRWKWITVEGFSAEQVRSALLKELPQAGGVEG